MTIPDPYLFESIGMIMVRTPLLPLDTIRPLLTRTLESNPAKELGGSPLSLAMLSQAIEHDTLAVQQCLGTLTRDPVVREALLVGCPDLVEAIPRWQQSPNGKRGRRVQAKLLRYMLRMSTRPTPFGLFAGAANWLSRTSAGYACRKSRAPSETDASRHAVAIVPSARTRTACGHYPAATLLCQYSALYLRGNGFTSRI